MIEKYCLNLLNYQKEKIFFRERSRIQKSQKHPELRFSEFLNRVRKAVTDPSFIYEDLN